MKISIDLESIRLDEEWGTTVADSIRDSIRSEINIAVKAAMKAHKDAIRRQVDRVAKAALMGISKEEIAALVEKRLRE